MKHQVVTVFGGSGFVGRNLVQRLAAAGATVRVAVRDTEAALFLKPLGDVGQIIPVHADITDPAEVAAAVRGADVVVNLVGILSEWGKRTFQRFHVEGAENVARAAKAAGARVLVHMSALGADPDSPAAYGRTKAAGEEAVRTAFPEAVIMRPSVIFGPDDDFFNRFAGLARITWVLPVFGCPFPPAVKLGGEHGIDVDLYGDGGVKFQPVYVGDVADAFMKAITDPAIRGRTYELGGPRAYSFKEIMDLMLKEAGRRRFLAPIPFWVAKIAAWFLEKWPAPMLTRDQLRLMERDNVVAEGAAGLAELGIRPTVMESVLPSYLHRYRPPNRQRSRLA